MLAREYVKKHLSPLMGGKIVDIVYEPSDSCNPYMGIIIKVGKREYEVVALSDPEGNGAGHLSIQQTKADK